MNPSQKANRWNSNIVTWAILFIALAIWSYFSFHNWIGDSEFWPVSLSGHWDKWKTQPALLFKFLFHLSLSWIYLFDLNSVEHLKFAKAFYTLLGASSFFLFFHILKKHISREKSLCVVFIFLLSHLGFTQIGLIRSDFLSFFLALIFFLIVPSKINPRSWLKWGILSFIFSSLLFLITPKSIFFGILAFFFIFFTLQGQARFRYVLTFGWLFIFIYFLFSKILFVEEVNRIIESTINFVYVSYTSKNSLPFFNLHLIGFLKNDALLWVLIICGLLVQFKNEFLNLQNWTAVGLGALLIIFVHRPALPFFVGSYWGLLFLSLIPLMKKIEFKYFVGVLAVTIGIFMFRFSFVYYYPNEVQYETIQVLEETIKNIPKGKIFDGLGVAPRAPLSLNYLGPYQRMANYGALKRIKKKRPALIVYTARGKLIEPQFSWLLQTHYKPVGIGYWLRKDIEIESEIKDHLGRLKPSFFVFGYYPVPEYLK